MITGADKTVRGVCLQPDASFLNPQLPPNEVHIWWAHLDLPAPRLRNLEETLARDEQARGERFRFERDRNRFIAARGILREILGYYLAMEPHSIRFDYGRHGKPRLAEGNSSSDTEFSLSHSQGVALYGFCRDHKIGVDVEYMRDFPDMDLIAKRFFSYNENEGLRAANAQKKTETFFRYWTQKEAFVKAIGVGLSYPLDSFFDVSVDPSELHGLTRLDGEVRQGAAWSIQNVNFIPNYVGAFAAESDRFVTKCWRWNVI